ncbi:hypothetical protein [Actinoplanes awajinensis]|uniref:hypothetical protein n=1 Tax=Actinoplanes awajinensis TaxID=135946 RepID=UPI000A823462|nr:hypothetical protein [Actinoplanes awajinensis]
MEQDETAPIADILRARGIPVTAEGMARAGDRLRAADERRDHAARAALLASLRTGVSTA